MEGSGGSSPSIANPAPLGLAGFAMTTFVLSMINANFVSGGDTGIVLGLALAYGGIAQLLAGMWEFKTGNTFGAVAFTSYGAFWISFWVLVTFNAAGLANADHAISLYLWAWAIFTAYMTVGSLKVSGAVLVVFVLLTATFIFLAIGQNNLPATGVDTMHKIGGYLGLLTALAAWYASFGGVVNSTFGKTVIPLFPAKK
jgi:succinate-acetate transporter protein